MTPLVGSSVSDNFVPIDASWRGHADRDRSAAVASGFIWLPARLAAASTPDRFRPKPSVNCLPHRC